MVMCFFSTNQIPWDCHFAQAHVLHIHYYCSSKKIHQISATLIWNLCNSQLEARNFIHENEIPQIKIDKKHCKMCSNERIELKFGIHIQGMILYQFHAKNFVELNKKIFSLIVLPHTWEKKQLVSEKRNPVSVLWHGVESSGKAVLDSESGTSNYSL